MNKYYKCKSDKRKWKVVKRYEDDKIKRIILKANDGHEWDMIESFFNAKFKEI